MVEADDYFKRLLLNMFHVEGSVYKNNIGSKEIEVLSIIHHNVFEYQSIHPPKILVAISLTLPKVDEFPEFAFVIPVLLDTGFNRTLEIDERHLESWTAITKSKLPFIEPFDKHGRTGSVHSAGIWLHDTTYKSPTAPSKNPYKLKNSRSIFIVDRSNNPWPPIPLLGLQALLADGINLVMDTKKGSFILTKKKKIIFLL